MLRRQHCAETGLGRRFRRGGTRNVVLMRFRLNKGNHCETCCGSGGRQVVVVIDSDWCRGVGSDAVVVSSGMSGVCECECI